MVIIDIVNKELTELMGGTQSKLAKSNRPPTVIMMAGLQGAGKTTTSGKLALMLKKSNHKPLLVAGDIYRPAAIKQLRWWAKASEFRCSRWEIRLPQWRLLVKASSMPRITDWIM